MHEEVAHGQLLAGKYRIERVLGQGGMGVVVAAHHLVLDQVVAIKFLLPEALRSAEAVARFEREARAAVKIQSEHVARVTDVGRLETGAPYMVMELLRGRDLADLLQQEGPLPLEDVADYILQAGEAIAEAHGLGIVHRDLKPPNLFLTTRADGSSCVKVLDFGISKVTNASSSSDQGMTSTTAVMGSPLYMSPEQLMSARDVDMTTDIWALGVICYELLTGKPPFVADTLPQLCMAISTAAPTPLRHYRPDVPVELEQLLARCLEKDRGKRFATVAQFANELVKFAPRRSRLSAERIERLARAAGFSASAFALPPSSEGQAVAIPNLATRTLGEFGRTKPEASPSRWGLGLAVGGVIALGAAGALVFARHAQISTVGGAAGSGTASAESWAPPSVSRPSSSAPAVVSQVVPQPDGPAPSASSAVRPPTPAVGLHEQTGKDTKDTGAVTQQPPTPAASVVPVTPLPRAAADCDIPYFYDSRGNKVFKKGCL
jgi:serine/threonine protein kinase